MPAAPLSRRRFLALTAAAAAAAAAPRTSAALRDDLKWYDVRDWGIEGRGWEDTAAYFDRLPARAEQTVREAVWNLSRHSAGMLVRFETDADTIWADYEVTSPRLAMPHMPATGVSGLDLYANDDQGHPRWLAVTRPDQTTWRASLVSGLAPGARVFTVYLPLYNGTRHLKIGLPATASFLPVKPRSERPVVFYGTSITHGACASRPGMPHPAILGRRLERPVINLGFSGNGKMESAVGALLCELDAAAFVIDCLPNMQAAEISQRAVPLVRQLRAARPKVPILLVEDRTFANAPFLPAVQQRHVASRDALRTAFQQLEDEGVERLFYLDGDKLLGEDRDDTTDGSHPSDLGFMRHADAMQPLLEQMLALAP